MTHRFLHIGDTHLSPGPRQADRLAALDQIVHHAGRLAAEGSLAATLWPGDIFHAKSTIDDRNALAPRLSALANLAPVVLCYGNHDHPGDLDLFSRLATSWPIEVVTTPHVLTLRTATRAMASIFVLPYPSRAGLVSAGTAHASLADEARVALDAIFIAAAAELEEAKRRGDLVLMTGHVNVGGALSSVGQPQIGQEIELDPALLARLGPIYKGLSHIHKHQVVHGAVYAGSICRMDFGEAEAKGFLEVCCELDEGSTGHVWTFVPLDVPRQLTIDGTLTRDGWLADEGGVDVDGADLRVRYRFRQADAGVLDLDLIRSAFAGARSLKLEGLAELQHEARAPEIVAAVTVDEKVRRYAERHGIAVTPRFDELLARLLQTDGAALVAEVQAAVHKAGSETPAEQVVA